MHSGKAPGQDGFLSFFFQNYWHIVEKEVTDAVQYFFHKSAMILSWSQTYIALVPKIVNPLKPTNFRPISFCNTIYKLMALILVQRLKPLVSNKISPEQGAFISSRSIMDNVLIV